MRSVSEDPRLQHCRRMGQLQSEHQYKREAASSQAQCHLPLDMVHLVHARKAQALASDRDYRTQCHEFTALPEDLRMAWARKAHALQSEVRGLWKAAQFTFLRPSCQCLIFISSLAFLSLPGPNNDFPGLCHLGWNHLFTYLHNIYGAATMFQALSQAL